MKEKCTLLLMLQQKRVCPTVMNYATLLDDSDEIEPLDVPFEMMKHGAKVYMTRSNLGDDGGLYVGE